MLVWRAIPYVLSLTSLLRTEGSGEVRSRPFLQNLEEHTLLFIAYGEGVFLIIDVYALTPGRDWYTHKLVRGVTAD